MFKRYLRTVYIVPVILVFTYSLESCSGQPDGKPNSLIDKIEDFIDKKEPDAYSPANAILISPAQPTIGSSCQIIVTGGSNLLNGKLVINGPSGQIKTTLVRQGKELPFWRLESFSAVEQGLYNAELIIEGKTAVKTEFKVTTTQKVESTDNYWKTVKGWNDASETLYSAWINALFQGGDEQSSWNSLHALTQDKERNFLYNHLGLGEDDASAKTHVVMEPDCADNPFFMRAYFAWKLGLPFGYHLCDRGYLGKNPQTGQWITNKERTSKSNPIIAFNALIRRVADGVHSGSARTSLTNENADYYPVPLTRSALRPGIVYADPYGHTLTLVSWVPQSKKSPGRLLAVDAQPDKTIAIKRFWKGNFLFNTSDVIGEPGFKAFRPIAFNNGEFNMVKNEELTTSSTLPPFSLAQRKMEQKDFYLTMERVINPQPLDPEVAFNDLLTALHEQLMVRVKSVSTGVDYLKNHPGTIVSMPSSANGVFLAGGDWENFSTPNRDLRLLIAIDAVLNFPKRVAESPQDFKISGSAEEINRRLEELLAKKTSQLTITYTRSNGQPQTLTIAQIIERRAALEMGYNPNDGVEIRWGAPLGSEERSSCKREAPVNQRKTMEAVRKWFNKRLHPPT